MQKTPARIAGVLDSFVRAVRWHRRSIATVLALVAVYAGVSAVRPEEEQTVTVIAAARDLPGGTRLASADLLPVTLPVDAAPAGAEPDASAFIGRSINGPLSSRSVVTRASVSTGADLAQPGHVVVAITLPNPALAPLIQPGTHVDVLASGRGGVLVSDVRVVATPTPETSMLMGSGSRLLLLEVTPDAAARLAGQNEAGGLTVAVR